MATKFTKRTVHAAQYADKRIFVWDSEVKGFGPQVLPSGIKSYVFQYRTAEGKTRRATIGKHGTLTADQARLKAREMQRRVFEGGAPPHRPDWRAAVRNRRAALAARGPQGRPVDPSADGPQDRAQDRQASHLRPTGGGTSHHRRAAAGRGGRLRLSTSAE